MVHENSLKNLRPAKHGDVRNPRGKIPGTLSTSKFLHQYLTTETIAKDINGDQKKLSIAEQSALVIVKKLLEGDPRFAEIFLERTEGKVTQPIESKNTFDLSGIAPEKLQEAIDRLKQ